MRNKMTGKIVLVNKKGGPNPDSYIIAEDGEENKVKTHLAHVGDLEENEQLLYSLYEAGQTATLEEGDKVQFELTSSGHVMHVKKLH